MFHFKITEEFYETHIETWINIILHYLKQTAWFWNIFKYIHLNPLNKIFHVYFYFKWSIFDTLSKVFHRKFAFSRFHESVKRNANCMHLKIFGLSDLSNYLCQAFQKVLNKYNSYCCHLKQGDNVWKSNAFI